MVADHPLTDPDLSEAMHLIRFDGSLIETRGVMSRLDQGASDVHAEFSGRGRQAWVSLESRLGAHEVEFVRTADGARFRVLATVNLSGVFRSARLQLRDRAEQAP